MDPCGTPHLVILESDSLPFPFAYWILFDNWIWQCTEPTGCLLYFMNQGGNFFKILYFKWFNGVRSYGYQPKLQFFAFMTHLAQQNHGYFFVPREQLLVLNIFMKEKIEIVCGTPCQWTEKGDFQQILLLLHWFPWQPQTFQFNIDS